MDGRGRVDRRTTGGGRRTTSRADGLRRKSYQITPKSSKNHNKSALNHLKSSHDHRISRLPHVCHVRARGCRADHFDPWVRTVRGFDWGILSDCLFVCVFVCLFVCLFPGWVARVGRATLPRPTRDQPHRFDHFPFKDLIKFWSLSV